MNSQTRRGLPTRERLTRRDFVRLSAIGLAGAGCGATGGGRATRTATGTPSAPEATPQRPLDVVPVVVDDVVESRQDDFGIILLKDANERFLPIWVGRFEAQSVRIGMNGVVTPRPMTYDFIRNLIQTMKATPVRVVITQLREMTFYANLEIRVGERHEALDCRPSDAIAVAVRMQTPIYIGKDIMDTQSVKRDDLEMANPPIWA